MLEKFKKVISLSMLKISDSRKRAFVMKFFLMVFVVIFGQILDFVLVGELRDFFLILVDFFMFAIFLNFFITLVRHLSVSVYRRRKKVDKSFFDNYILGISAIAILINVILVIISVFYFFDIDFMVFVTSFALFFAGLSWVFKDYVMNVVNGYILIFSEDIRIGDYLGFEEFKGRVKTISFLNTELRTDEGNIIFIPNTVILSSEIINFSREKFKRIILEYEINKENFGKIDRMEKFLFKRLKDEFEDLVIDEFLYLRVNKILVDRVLVNFEISVSKYNFKIEEKIKKFASICILDFIDKKFE